MSSMIHMNGRMEIKTTEPDQKTQRTWFDIMNELRHPKRMHRNETSNKMENTKVDRMYEEPVTRGMQTSSQCPIVVNQTYDP